MKKGIVCALLMTGLLFCAGISFAATTQVNYPEISMQVPSYLSVAKNNYDGAFPASALANFNTMNILVLPGQFPDIPSMQTSMAQLSGIPFVSWTLAASSENDAGGWALRREYQAVGPDNSVAYTVLGQGAMGSYIVMFSTSQDDYSSNSGDYQTWRSTVNVAAAALPEISNPPAPPVF